MADQKFEKSFFLSVEVKISSADEATYKAAIERVTGAGGDEFREHLYDLNTERDVLEHWASNCVANGIGDVRVLDGWADMPKRAITMSIGDVDADE